MIVKRIEDEMWTAGDRELEAEIELMMFENTVIGRTHPKVLEK